MHIDFSIALCILVLARTLLKLFKWQVNIMYNGFIQILDFISKNITSQNRKTKKILRLSLQRKERDRHTKQCCKKGQDGIRSFKLFILSLCLCSIFVDCCKDLLLKGRIGTNCV